MSTVLDVTTSTFDETVNGSHVPVLVDFWAPWCGPCRTIAPIVEQVAGEHTGRLTVVKVNVDDHADLAARFSVMSIPTLLLFVDGKPVERVVGARSHRELTALVAPHLR